MSCHMGIDLKDKEKTGMDLCNHSTASASLLFSFVKTNFIHEL